MTSPPDRGPSAVGALLVRHASALDRGSWSGEDRQRPLDGRGRAQAHALPAHLATHGLAPVHLVSSPTRRCIDTLRPLADALGLELHEDERFVDATPSLPSQDGWVVPAWLAGRAVAGLDQALRGFAPGATPATVPPGMSSDDQRVVVVCSHGELLPALLAAVAARDGWRVARGPDLSRKAMAKGSAWLLAGGRDVVTIDAPAIPTPRGPGAS